MTITELHDYIIAEWRDGDQKPRKGYLSPEDAESLQKSDVVKVPIEIKTNSLYEGQPAFNFDGVNFYVDQLLAPGGIRFE